ncbi:nickel-dependent lactate racemase [Oscillibacter sp.]|uniref:nickel-dependent lactate racemase n=1 Tax=Oscillibacter sp. TaxID=1945593 RepID=UPI00289CF2F0|nr:nickel-dependent lactate racemase [Oscillibacter sp.]
MKEREVTLRCGENRYTVKIPDHIRFQYARLNSAEQTADPQVLIQEAFNHPAGAPRIEDMVQPGQKICIISDDNTRLTPVALILKELLPRLEGAGVRREDIFIIMALGSHRPMTAEEMTAKLGRDVCQNYRVFNSEFENPALLTQVGVSALGTPIRVFKAAMEADFRIGIGSVVPHGCMGWSGGAKILYPGITSADIVSEFHVMQGLRDEILLGMVECPVRLAVEEWTQNIGLHYIINTVLGENAAVYSVSAGHYIQAHRKAVSSAQKLYGVSVGQRPDVVLSSAYPIHMDFWQCGKATYGPTSVLRTGGEFLLLAECKEGVGPHSQMLDYMAMENGKDALQKRIKSGDTGEDLLAMAVGVSMGRVVRHAHVTLVSDGLTAEQCERGRMAHRPQAALQQALEQALAKFEDPFLLVIPEGGEAIPILGAEV